MPKRLQRKPKKVRLAADGTPYTVWQTRTRILCFLLLGWAVVEIAVGAGFLTLAAVGIFDFSELAPAVVFGPSTVVSGVFNLVVSLAGLWGAHNPRRITLFFWVMFLNALLSSWQTASAWSMGQFDPATIISLVIAIAYAVCAWNVRGQTGYFDNHPKPDDPDELPIEREARRLREAEEAASSRRQKPEGTTPSRRFRRG